MARTCTRTIIAGRAKFDVPGVKFRWNMKMFKVMGAKTIKARGARKPINKRNPQVVSVILSKGRKYPEPMMPFMNSSAAGGMDDCGIFI